LAVCLVIFWYVTAPIAVKTKLATVPDGVAAPMDALLNYFAYTVRPLAVVYSIHHDMPYGDLANNRLRPRFKVDCSSQAK
jgi:hypothetical protein